MNSRKGVFGDVLDPFEVEWGWFVLELVSYQIYANPDLDPTPQATVEATIQRLRLRDDECRRAREAYGEAYFGREIRFAYLRRKCPIVADEIERQGRRLPDDG